MYVEKLYFELKEKLGLIPNMYLLQVKIQFRLKFLTCSLIRDFLCLLAPIIHELVIGLGDKGNWESTYNPHHIRWDSWDVFCPPNVGLCELASQKQKIQHWEGKSTTFCRYMVFESSVPMYCDEDVFYGNFWGVDRQELSLFEGAKVSHGTQTGDKYVDVKLVIFSDVI